jgi:hypothetical protein
MLASNIVSILFDGHALDKIYVTMEQYLQFDFGRVEIPRLPLDSVFECDQDIHVAVGAEIVAEDRPEEGEFNDLPFLAEGLDGVVVQGNLNCHVTLPGTRFLHA